MTESGMSAWEIVLRLLCTENDFDFFFVFVFSSSNSSLKLYISQSNKYVYITTRYYNIFAIYLTNKLRDGLKGGFERSRNDNM